ncbi:hypothetical protein Ancab_006617 [Ancistrocladus abbreviatus]
MEPAKIDWKTIDSEFVSDDMYEHINAPQWIDFLASDDSAVDHDDELWFCRPDCKHPKTYEDFLKSTPTSKMLRTVSVSKLMALGDWYRRDGNLKRRGLAQSSNSSLSNEDGENQNPNLSTPIYQIKSMKAAVKSSAEKKEERDNDYSEILLADEKPRLKSTLSARDLFGGNDIFNKITEFCHELKKMATRKREENGSDILNAKKRSLESKAEAGKDVSVVSLDKLDEKERERKPLLEVSEGRYETGNRSNTKEKQRKKKRAHEAENIPVPLNMENVKRGDQKCLLPIRTSPPTPQCFSATRDPPRTTPSKGPKSRLLMEKEISQEVKQKEVSRQELGSKTNTPDAPVIAGREGKALDVFWFLKPCTLSS